MRVVDIDLWREDRDLPAPATKVRGVLVDVGLVREHDRRACVAHQRGREHEPRLARAGRRDDHHVQLAHRPQPRSMQDPGRPRIAARPIRHPPLPGQEPYGPVLEAARVGDWPGQVQLRQLGPLQVQQIARARPRAPSELRARIPRTQAESRPALPALEANAGRERAHERHRRAGQVEHDRRGQRRQTLHTSPRIRSRMQRIRREQRIQAAADRARRIEQHRPRMNERPHEHRPLDHQEQQHHQRDERADHAQQNHRVEVRLRATTTGSHTSPFVSMRSGSPAVVRSREIHPLNCEIRLCPYLTKSGRLCERTRSFPGPPG